MRTAHQRALSLAQSADCGFKPAEQRLSSASHFYFCSHKARILIQTIADEGFDGIAATFDEMPFVFQREALNRVIGLFEPQL